MQLKIKTEELQKIVGKLINCVSNNKLIPLTSLMNIKVISNKLTLTTTDAKNFFSISSVNKFDCEDFEISVMADLFTKLIQKITVDEITLELEGNVLTIKGNGKYVMELPLDESSKAIKFPNKVNAELVESGNIQLSTVKVLLANNKASLSDNFEIPCLTCYYCGDEVITSDQFKICDTRIKMFEKPKLVSSATMNLLGEFDSENIKYHEDENCVVFYDDTMILYTPNEEGAETFPAAAIMGLVESTFNSMCKISKSALLSVLDRLTLFVSPYDKKGIYLTFTKDGLMLSSKKSSGSELLPYIASDNFEPYVCCIDVDMLKTQVSTYSLEDIELWFGSEIAIKLVDNNIIKIIAFLEYDGEEL